MRTVVLTIMFAAAFVAAAFACITVVRRPTLRCPADATVAIGWSRSGTLAHVRYVGYAHEVHLAPSHHQPYTHSVFFVRWIGDRRGNRADKMTSLSAQDVVPSYQRATGKTLPVYGMIYTTCAVTH